MSNIRVSGISNSTREMTQKTSHTKNVGETAKDAPRKSSGPVIIERPPTRVAQALQTYLHYRDGVQKEAEQAVLSEMFGVDTYV